MYSFNLDFIFNFVYNIFLAIRYAILFLILGIDKRAYLEDHKFDTYDGLRDRGWIDSNIGLLDSNSNVIYLGNNGEEKVSWWSTIKHNIFGWGENVGSISSNSSYKNSFNPNDVGFVIDKTNNNPWFSNLKFSIQNPILSFFADLLSVLTFFLLLLFIYIIFRWFFLVMEPVFKSKEEIRLKKLEEERKIKENRILELKEFKVNKNVNEEERKIEVKKQKIENSMPAGISNLPIDENDLDRYEIDILDKKEDILLNYKTKNIIPKKENQILKVNTPAGIVNIIEKEREISAEEKKRLIQIEERKNWFKDRWNIIVGYMEGKEEALWRIGILEADNLLDELLIDRGYQGLTMSDKLKQANFNTIDLAWNAHKMRNRIAHDGSKFILTDRMARNTLELYRSVFNEFKIFE